MIIAAFLVQIVLLAKAAWLYQERYNPDALIYLRMAGYYLNGQLDLVVTGGWGPLFSWTIIPWLLVFPDDHLLAAHAAVACSAVVFLYGTYRLLLAMKLPREAVVVGTWLTAFISAAWTTIVISPDLLMAGIFCYGISRLLLAKWTVGSGLIFGATYLAKPIGLPLSLLVVAALSVIYRSGFKPTMILCIGFLLVAAPWVGLVSYKYGRPTFSTIGPIQHAIMGPPDKYRDHPDHLHFYKPEPGRITIAEDPTNLPYNYWSPFESWEYFIYQLRLIRSNALLAVNFLQSFDWLGLGLISAVCGIFGGLKSERVQE